MRINGETWDDDIEETHGNTTNLKEENTTRVMFMNVGSLPFNNWMPKIGKHKPLYVNKTLTS